MLSLGAHLAVTLFAAATPSPQPTQPPPELVTPGFGGFIIIAFLVVAVALLVWDMQRRVRRARYRQEIGAELDAEMLAAEQAAAATAVTETDDQSIDEDPSADDAEPPTAR